MRQVNLGILGVLLLFVAFSLPIVFSSIPTVQAVSNVGVIWGSRYDQTTYEIQAMEYTASTINSYFLSRYPSWGSQNAFATSGVTKGSNVYSTAEYCRDNYAFVATFHAGHFVKIPVDCYRVIGWVYFPYPHPILEHYVTWHYGYYGDFADYSNAYNNRIQDNNLYPYTGSKHRFTLIWTCVNADLFDTDDPPDGIGDAYGYYDDAYIGAGAVGMPYAWTRTTTLSQNGYANSDSSNFCYIGFENNSRALTDNSEFINKNYGDFVRKFYWHAVNNRYSIKVSLNKAVDEMGTWHQYLWQTELYNGYWGEDMQGQYTMWCKMRIYGNTNMQLPA
jgi:hypothetical protein